jgi:hypothetical protein
MRQLARLLLAFVVVPGLLLPQGGSYCLARLFGGGDAASKAKCDACCCHAVRTERHESAAAVSTKGTHRSSDADKCCVSLPEIGGAVDSTAQARVDAQRTLAQLATPLFFAPDDFATSVAADGRFAFASRGPPDAPRALSVPIALPLRL